MEHAVESARQAGRAPSKGVRAQEAALDAAPLHPALQLQRGVGNQAVLAMLRAGALQAKLSVGAVDDPLEHEADRVADEVMRMPDPAISVQSAPPQISRKCAACAMEADEKEKQLRMKPAGAVGSAGGEAPQAVHDVLASPGQLLDRRTRSFFESRFGQDFSDVRVHADQQGAESAASVGALAYTAGSNIAFASGRYDPSTNSGRSLLAHELTHVVQQRSRPRTIQRQDGSDDGGGAPATPAPAPITAETLDQEYQTAVRMGDWQAAAEWLNGFSKDDIRVRLAKLNQDQITLLHKGALDNPRVGPQSQIAQMSEAFGPPAAPTPAPAATPSPPPADASQQAPQTDGGAPSPDTTTGPATKRDATSENSAVRDRQLACVVRMGGCASTRDGGLPSTDDVQSYNDQCKRDNQYAGPVITPTDEECKNPPKEGLTTEDVLPGILVLAGGVLAAGAVVALVVAAPEIAAAAAPIIARVGARVMIRLAPALTTLGPAAAPAEAAIPAVIVSAESAPAVVEGGALVARGTQVLRVVVQEAPTVAKATQAATQTIAVSNTASTVAQAVAAASAITATAAAVQSDSPSKDRDGENKDKGGKNRPPCMSESALCDYQKLLISSGLPESARFYFTKMVGAHGGSIPLYCRSGNQYGDAKTFSIIMAQQGEWGIVQACSKDNGLLGFAAGSKNYAEKQHAEIKALGVLETQLLAIPIVERVGGLLSSACIKPACKECRPALEAFAAANLPSGPPPVDLACGNPEYGIPNLAYFAYLHVFEENCTASQGAVQ